MIGRDEFLKRVDHAYAMRAAGDKEGLASVLAETMSFRIAGEHLPIPGVPRAGSAIAKINEMIDVFRIHSIERVDAVVEGNKAAVLSRAVLSYKNGEKITAEFYDLWVIGDDGKFTSITQFGDAALVAYVLAMA